MSKKDAWWEELWRERKAALKSDGNLLDDAMVAYIDDSYVTRGKRLVEWHGILLDAARGSRVCAGIRLEKFVQAAIDFDAERHADRETMAECVYPDCGCPEARLCMATEGPNFAARVLNLPQKKRRS